MCAAFNLRICLSIILEICFKTAEETNLGILNSGYLSLLYVTTQLSY